MGIDKELPEDVVKDIDHDAVARHLVLLTLRYSALLNLIYVGFADSLKSKTFARG